MTNLVHKSGLSDAEWMQRSLDGARSDPIGMWQMVRAGREGFGLSGAPLEDFVQRFITEMITGGAEPIVGDDAAEFGWISADRPGGSPKETAEALVEEWTRSGVDPDVDGVWFAFPQVWK
ncbi:hypothetical protein [Roseateles chitinivorans]|uniref:hypothetical protein n=1 Tax=Roseateles chitinivorans TaxID=2917965 RepID=UPI003D66852F